jgi:hypothetical protein
VGEHEWTDVNYNWTGSLEFLEEATIEIPIENYFWKDEIAGGLEFHAKILSPNGGVDEYANNDQYNVSFKSTPVINDPFYIWFKTNNKAYENSIYLKDEAGEIVWSRTNLENSTEYKDTFELAAGCYSLELYDSDHDGIGFWYSSQVEGETSGFLRIRKVSGSIVKTFDTDFGHYTKYNFSVGYKLGTEEEVLNYNFDIYPNPSNGLFNITLNNFVGNNVSIEVYNELGQKVTVINNESQNPEGYWKTQLDLSTLEKGIYFVKVIADNQIQTKRIVIQ